MPPTTMKFVYTDVRGSGAWFIEKRYFGSRFGFVVATCLESELFLGLFFGDDIEEGICLLCDDLTEKNGVPTAIITNTRGGLWEWCRQKGVDVREGEAEADGGGTFLERFLIESVLHLTTNRYKKWRQSWPPHLKNVPSQKKVQNVGFRKLLFESAFFEKDVNVLPFLEKGLSAYNEKKRECLTPTPLVEEPQNQVNIEQYFNRLFKEVSPEQAPLLDAIRASFLFQARLGLVQYEKIKKLEEEQKKNLERLDALVLYKEKKESQEAEKALRRQKRLNRVRKARSQPFRKEYLLWVFDYMETHNFTNLTKMRLRLVIIILLLTGVRVSEVRRVKVSQVTTLFDKNYLMVDLLKQGQRGHKIFLTKEGQALLKDYKKEFFDFLYLSGLIKKIPARGFLKNMDLSVLNRYLFSSHAAQGTHPMSRSFLTRQINQILSETPELVERGIFFDKPQFSTRFYHATLAEGRRFGACTSGYRPSTNRHDFSLRAGAERR